MRRIRSALRPIPVVLAALAAAACGAGAAPAAGDDAPPARLSETGLYRDIASGSLAEGVLPYSPQYPLWTDGARKARWIRIPSGRSIDASDPDCWDFPAGTKLWKEFAYERRVETRLLERREDGSWTFAAYVWNAGQTEAFLAPSAGVKAAYTGVAADGAAVRHDVPGRTDCLACHGGRASPPLGVGTLQLSPDRDPLAPHADTPSPGDADLRTLAARGLLRGLDGAFLKTPPRIEASSPEGRASLGYLHANCGSCHSSQGPLASLGFDLEVRFAGGSGRSGAPVTASGRAGAWRPRGAAGPCDRIAPGAPERSAVLLRMRAADPVTRMPPLGTRIPDDAASALVASWITHDLAPAGAAPLSKETVR